jgi:altronate dehydratase small subunit
MKNKATAVVIHEKDTVATALRSLPAGAVISIDLHNRVETIKLLDDIPAGHKFALMEIEEGSDVIKYGEPIGQSTVKILRGEHVHTHNTVSRKKQENR